MLNRGKFVSGSLVLGVTACAAAAAWWWLDVDRSDFYTDGASIQAAQPGHTPRDVLWQTPEPVTTADGVPIAAIDAFISGDECD
mgnify:CR=1 FL=1